MQPLFLCQQNLGNNLMGHPVHTQWKINILANSTRPLLREQKRAYLLKQTTENQQPSIPSSAYRIDDDMDTKWQKTPKADSRGDESAASNCIIRLSPGPTSKKSFGFVSTIQTMNFTQMGLGWELLEWKLELSLRLCWGHHIWRDERGAKNLWFEHALSVTLTPVCDNPVKVTVYWSQGESFYIPENHWIELLSVWETLFRFSSTIIVTNRVCNGFSRGVLIK